MFKRYKKMHDEGKRQSATFLSRLLRDRSGNTLAMAAAALIPIAGMIGSGLDMSRAYMAQAKLQNACDAAALAARRHMDGSTFDAQAEAEGERFFNFNFPADTMSAQNISVAITQHATDATTVEVNASADIPTTIMSMFGRDTIAIDVTCDATVDYGHNDVMLVLDVTGSMNSIPSTGGTSTKIQLLRAATGNLYSALASTSNSRTRFGIMPYSQTVNVGRSLRNMDILRENYFWTYSSSRGIYQHQVALRETFWGDGQNHGNSVRQFRVSGDACIEERASYGNSAYPIVISQTVTQDDIDVIAANNGNQQNLQWGFYDPNQYSPYGVTSVCPEEASKLTEYASASAFSTAISNATATVSGNTYHDIGMIWAMRFLSSTGMFSSDNATLYNGGTVNQHIIFLTDGQIATNRDTYTAYGLNRYGSTTLDERVQLGSDSRNQAHIDRFLSACSVARSMGMTVWVIALDVTSSSDIEPCASGPDYFYESNGTDLADVFATIGQGIGRLRLSE